MFMRVGMLLLSGSRPARSAATYCVQSEPSACAPLQEALAAENAVLEKFVNTQQVCLYGF